MKKMKTFEDYKEDAEIVRQNLLSDGGEGIKKMFRPENLSADTADTADTDENDFDEDYTDDIEMSDEEVKKILIDAKKELQETRNSR